MYIRVQFKYLDFYRTNRHHSAIFVGMFQIEINTKRIPSVEGTR